MGLDGEGDSLGVSHIDGVPSQAFSASGCPSSLCLSCGRQWSHRGIETGSGAVLSKGPRGLMRLGGEGQDESGTSWASRPALHPRGTEKPEEFASEGCGMQHH